MGEAPAGLTFSLLPLAPGTRGLTPLAFSKGVLPGALGALPPGTPPAVSVSRGTPTVSSGAPLPHGFPRTERAIGGGPTPPRRRRRRASRPPPPPRGRPTLPHPPRRPRPHHPRPRPHHRHRRRRLRLHAHAQD